MIGPAGDPASIEPLVAIEDTAAVPEVMTGELIAEPDNTDPLALIPLAGSELLNAVAVAVFYGTVPIGLVPRGAVPLGALPVDMVMEADG